MRKVIFKTDEKRKKIAVAEQLIGEEKKGVLPLPEDFLCTTLIFMSCNEWTETQLPLPVLNFTIVTKNTKLKEDEFLSVLWIINLKNTEKSCRASCHDFSCRLSLYPSDQLELFEFQHDSRLYKGISVHVCIYLFMCNLMGIVNMVRLLKLLFYLSGASCFSGFEYSVSSSCDFMVLRKQKFFGVLFISLGYFNSALL